MTAVGSNVFLDVPFRTDSPVSRRQRPDRAVDPQPHPGQARLPARHHLQARPCTVPARSAESGHGRRKCSRRDARSGDSRQPSPLRHPGRRRCGQARATGSAGDPRHEGVGAASGGRREDGSAPREDLTASGAAPAHGSRSTWRAAIAAAKRHRGLTERPKRMCGATARVARPRPRSTRRARSCRLRSGAPWVRRYPGRRPGSTGSPGTPQPCRCMTDGEQPKLGGKFSSPSVLPTSRTTAS